MTDSLGQVCGIVAHLLSILMKGDKEGARRSIECNGEDCLGSSDNSDYNSVIDLFILMEDEMTW